MGGHHGVIPNSADLRNIGTPQLGDNRWHEARTEILRSLADEFRLDPLQVPRAPTHDDAAFWLFLAGLISVADWIGSNRTYFKPVGIDIVPIDYVTLSRDKAREAIHELGFDRWKPKLTGSLSFRKVHRTIDSPRPLQDACEVIARQHLTEPALVLIEAPMGEGKTEAAVYLADHATHVLGGRGLYIALPTQATANQMFGRIETWLRQRYDLDAEAGRLNLQLLHGRKGFSEAYNRLLDLAAIDDDLRRRPPSADANNRPAAHVVAESWFAKNAKQQLLAPFGVGTIDQVLLAVLQTKHHFVRLFGLASKTVILDEVHAYDAYMTTLLEQVLKWLYVAPSSSSARHFPRSVARL